MDKPTYWKETVHSMTRRSSTHDYGRQGCYHVTISVAEGRGHPLGYVAGNLNCADGEPNAPHVVLSPLGQMVEEELTHSISKHYPMVEVQDYVIMPEHLHVLIVVHDRIYAPSGRPAQLGRIIAGFKQGCNRRYREMIGMEREGKQGGQGKQGGEGGLVEQGGQGGQGGQAMESPVTRGRVLGNSIAKQTAGSITKQAAGGIAKQAAGGIGEQPAQHPLPPLFAPGFCDVMPFDAEQLTTQRAYIHANPRSRLLRTTRCDVLQAQRGAVDTLITLPALRGYLKRECPAYLVQEAALQALEARLLVKDKHIVCDSYGERQLLQRQLLPVVCHRSDKGLFGLQKERCLQAARGGCVLASARIAKGEQEIMDAAIGEGLPVVLVLDNGFPDKYHPTSKHIDLCATGQLLILSPWAFQFRPKESSISVVECKTMNCVAQAICRTKDDWWKQHH